MKKNVLIVEDKLPHINALKKILSEINEVEVFTASSKIEALNVVANKHIHLFLVDIILEPTKTGDVSGINFVTEIRNNKKYEFTPVIFTTSLEDPKLYSYRELHCFGYMEKPYDPDEVKKLIKAALNFPVEDNYDEKLYLRKDGIIYSVKRSDIVYIKFNRRKMTVYCVNDKLEITYKTVTEMINELDSDKFVQCSRNVIINKQYVETVDFTNRYIKMQGIDEQIEIGITMKNRIRESFYG